MKHTPSIDRRDFLTGAAGALLGYVLFKNEASAAPIGDAAGAAASLVKRAAGSFERPRLFHSLARGLAMIPGRAPVVAVAERGLHAVAARPARPADGAIFAADASSMRRATLMRSRYLGVVLDPWTMQPVDEHFNEVTNLRAPVIPRRLDETMLLTGSVALARTDSVGADIRRRRISEADFGTETIVSCFETALSAPEARPSVTSLSYRAATSTESRTGAAVDFSMSLLFAAENWPWLGFPPSMRAQIMLNVTGKSIDDIASLDPKLPALGESLTDFTSFVE